MFKLGVVEIIIIIIILIIIFLGGKKLGELAKSISQVSGKFKKIKPETGQEINHSE